MQAFAELLDKLYYTPRNLVKAELIKKYLAETPDPDRGWAVAALAGTLNFDLFKRNLITTLMHERTDEYLYQLSRDYVGETSETAALLWPVSEHPLRLNRLPSLAEVVEEFRSRDKAGIADYLVTLMDNMTPPQRWALLKLGTRGLRVGVSARFLKKVLAEYGGAQVEEIERLWHGLEPPYTELLAWLDGKAEKPDVSDRVTFHPVMLSHPLEEPDYAKITPQDYVAEWKYDGIRVQLVSTARGKALFSRTGDDISGSFPDLLEKVDFHGIFDGELLVLRDGKIGSFNELQQRLGRKNPSPKLMREFPAGMMLYDVLNLEDREVTSLPLIERQQLLRDFHQAHWDGFVLSEPLPFDSFDDLAALRATTAATEDDAGDGESSLIEGLMLKRKDSIYVPGRPKGQWYKWKRNPLLIDAVMMYAQRGSGKRSSFYSDFTFGLWEGEQLLPVGKAYSGFTDEELKKLDHWVRNHTLNRFGPVREVKKELVVELAFDSVHASNRHKSGLAMRFPRVHRIRWDKPAAEADLLESLKKLIG